MQRLKDEGQDILNPMFRQGAAKDNVAATMADVKEKIVMTLPGVTRKITLEELQAHNTESEPWFVVEGEVYDGTGFLKDHPGGKESITLMAGEDATEDL